MGNEPYLTVSYFAAAAAGVVGAVVVALVLRKALRRALAVCTSPLAHLLRRALPAWLILAVLLGFLSVTYFDCEHGSYETIVADREHLIGKTCEQGSTMSLYVAGGLVLFSLLVGLAIFAHARKGGETEGPGRGQVR
jgi:hypothetical protein